MSDLKWETRVAKSVARDASPEASLWINELAQQRDDLYEALEEAKKTIQYLIDDGFLGYVDLRTTMEAAMAKARGEHND